MTNPLVSIIIPVRNCKRFIEETLTSILDQDYSNFELLIVDDGSTDYDYVLFEKLDPRIKTLNSGGRGVSAARNLGLSTAQGEYFAFNDADDIWFPGKLKAQINYLIKHPEVGMVFGRLVTLEETADGSFPEIASLSVDCHNFHSSSPSRSGWIYTRLLMGLLVGMNTPVIRRSVYEKIGGFDESLVRGEDYDFWLRCSQITEMHCLDGVVAIYRIHRASTMSQFEKCNSLADLLISAKKRWGLTNPDGTSISESDFNKRIAETEFNHAYKHFWAGNPSIAKKHFIKSLQGGHLPLRSIIYVLLSTFMAIFKVKINKSSTRT